MAYDAQKAHEYYINYRKKGLKKGRKKGTGASKATATLLGTSISGLNDEGRIQASLIKEKLKKVMNEALKKAKTDEEREKIRLEYSRKAVQQIAALKADSRYARPKATKSSSGSKGSGGSSKSSGGSQASGEQSKATATKATATMKKAPLTFSYDNSGEISEQAISNLTLKAEALMALAKTMPAEAKKRVAQTVESIIEQLKLLRGE